MKALKFAIFVSMAFLAAPAPSQSFVQRDHSRLTLDGLTFRYSGPNIEWLGLEGYGPHDPAGPRFPTHFEIEDGLATAAEMGARVVRVQSMGDTVGCPLCIEPEQGKFNPAAFQASDYAIAVAKQHGMRIIVTLIGDCATCGGGGIGQFLTWNHKTRFQDFFTDPSLIAAYEAHVDAVLNHRNPLTGLLYRDDSTIMAWENCNMCGLVPLLTGGKAELAQVAAWSETVGAHIKSVDHKHLYLDTTGIFRSYPEAIANPSTDMVTFEFYPHWDSVFGLGGPAPPTTAANFVQDAAAITSRDRVFIVNEYGWDNTNWKTPADLQTLLDTLTGDPQISGDDFWELQAHLNNFGFQPIPADSKTLPFAREGECGEWWALYYPGIKTLAMSAEDMASRAQQLRGHAYDMAGLPLPKHNTPPAPVVTSVVVGGLVAWRGSAGAVRYSVERFDSPSKQWKTVCDKCATDADDPWIDPHPILLGAEYRVIAWNADGVRNAP